MPPKKEQIKANENLSVLEPADSPAQTYEAKLEQVEDIIKQLDQGELSLEQMITLYKQGMELIDQNEKYLSAIEEELKIIERTED